jgi:hypothetical protein
MISVWEPQVVKILNEAKLLKSSAVNMAYPNQLPELFHIERKNNNKTRANLKLFLATGFEFGYTVTALR